MTEDQRREKYVEAAKRLYEREGEIEIDENAELSDSGDPGEYVQAWVWVPQDEAGDGHTFSPGVDRCVHCGMTSSECEKGYRKCGM